jgi:hypothetical protein
MINRMRDRAHDVVAVGCVVFLLTIIAGMH